MKEWTHLDIGCAMALAEEREVFLHADASRGEFGDGCPRQPFKGSAEVTVAEPRRQADRGAPEQSDDDGG
ncbi:hypothetical protein [Paraburkholderia bengalensis]|uniref:hypothetical protein n=1 Tax=Paraburkholderia bengalensis TaxID=2747562 RepID=UPI003014B459